MAGQSARIFHSDGALFIQSESAQQTSSAVLTTPSTARKPERTVNDEVAINVDWQQSSSSSNCHSTNESRAVPTSVTEDQLATSTSECSPRDSIRQVTFGVQTEPSRSSLPSFVLQGDDGMSSARNNEINGDLIEPWLWACLPWLDCSGLCYFSFATSMFLVGIVILIFTANSNNISATPTAQRPPKSCCQRIWSNMDSAFVCYGLTGSVLIVFGSVVLYLVAIDERLVRERTTAESTSQLWIVGPIFICSGVLVCVKAFTHIYNRLQLERLIINSSTRRGGFLTSDSRPSLNAHASLPPNYSAALVAPIPSGVIEEDDKLPDPLSDADAASLARVTINFDPPPPTYEEAMVVLRRDSQIITPSSVNLSSSTNG